jgi:hypothetical protein
MKTEQIEIFVHASGRPQVIAACLTETLKEVLLRIDALPSADQFVFIGECVEAISRPEAEEDMHETAIIELTLEQLELDKHKHVHTRAIHRVEVTVHFNGEHKKRRFSPATTIATVTAWAKERFKIDPSAGADLVLALKPDETQPRPDVHLGELLKPGMHSLEFDLVREVTPQGWIK